MFSEGQLITGIPGENLYGLTNQYTLLSVVEVMTVEIRVKIVGVDGEQVGRNNLGQEYDVEANAFRETTAEEFQILYPNAEFDSSISVSVSNTSMLCDMDADYEPTKEEMDKLIEDAMFLSNRYGYHFTVPGLKNLFRQFFRSKGWLINTIKSSPNYVGNFQIVWDDDFPRDLDLSGIKNFGKYIYTAANRLLVPYVDESGVKLSDLTSERGDYKNIIKDMQNLSTYSSMSIALDGHSIEYFIDRLSWIEDNILKYKMASKTLSGECYTMESFEKFQLARDFADFIKDIKETFTNKSVEEDLNENFPNAHAHEGQKITKPVRKVLEKLGFTKLGPIPENCYGSFEQEFAKFADAVAITTLKRRSVISVNPIDYLTMSFGNSWQSCHTIDKRNRRHIDSSHTYSGMHSGGTISYMLDGSSMVYYTVDNSVSENYQLSDKIQRNMFHFSYDKLVQGRVYPQSNDGDTVLSDLIRNHVQDQIAKCFTRKISWVVNRGVDACSCETISHGQHYPDYRYFSTCNVSYMKVNGIKHKFPEKIHIGHDTVCPSCGSVHGRTENIECRNCERQELITCTDCGCVVDRNDFRIINGNAYCLTCRPRTNVQPVTEEIMQLAG